MTETETVRETDRNTHRDYLGPGKGCEESATKTEMWSVRVNINNLYNNRESSKKPTENRVTWLPG